MAVKKKYPSSFIPNNEMGGHHHKLMGCVKKSPGIKRIVEKYKQELLNLRQWNGEVLYWEGSPLGKKIL